MRRYAAGSILFVLVMLTGILFSSAAMAESLTVSIPRNDVEVERDGENYALFSGKNVHFLTDTGEPEIPFHIYKIALPQEADSSNLAISLENVREDLVEGKWNVRPVAPPATWDEEELVLWPGEKNLEDGRDSEIYGIEEIFPLESLRPFRTGEVRGHKVVDVPVALYRYSPAEGSLYRLTGADIVIEYGSGYQKTDVAMPAEKDSIADEMLREQVINYGLSDADGQLSSRAVEGEPQAAMPGYVVITTSYIRDRSTRLADFADQKRSRGFEVYVVTEVEWGGGSGDVAAERIRSWLRSNYQSSKKNIKYALMVGNPDPASGNVPMKRLWPRRNETLYTEYRDSPSDLYYADLTGNWDSDGDGYYGEGDDDAGIDTNWDIYVGRIPCYGDVTALDAILSKIMNYENADESSTAWRRKVLLPMKPSDGETPGWHLGEAVVDEIARPSGWGYYRIYDNVGGAPAPETWGCTMDNVASRWQSQRPGAVVWWTHGSATAAASVMDSYTTRSLDDGHPAFVFQTSCLNAYPENSGNLSYSLLKNGAIATVGATRTSWYTKGGGSVSLGSKSNAGMAYDFTSRLIAGMKPAGDALASLSSGYSAISTTWKWMNITDFNLYGDPSVGIYASSVSLHSISGRIRNESGTGVAGVTIATDEGKSATTDDNGYYVISGLSDGTYRVTPSKAPYIFSPTSLTETVSGGNLEKRDFTATAEHGGLTTLIPEAPAGAGWRVTTEGGTSSWMESNATISGLVVGDHTITFRSVPGKITPSSRTVTIRADTTARITSGRYVDGKAGDGDSDSGLPRDIATSGGGGCSVGSISPAMIVLLLPLLVMMWRR